MANYPTSFDKDGLLKCARGELFGPGNAQLPLPPMLMFDRISAIAEDGGANGKGMIRAELNVRPDLWFFACHFKGDHVMKGCLGLDALWLMLGLFMAYVLRHPVLSRYRFWRGWKHPNLGILRQLVAVGLPIAVTFMLELGMFAGISYMAGSLGTEVLAAHQIAFQSIAIIFMVPLGMAQAVTARVGLWFGQGDRVGMRRAGFVAIAAAAGFLAMSGIALYFGRSFMISLFIDQAAPQNAAVVVLAMNLLLVTVAAQIVDGILRVTMNCLYGLQDTNVPMGMSAIAYWGIGLTTAYTLCFVMGWGAVGLWIGQYTGVGVAGIIFFWRFCWLTRRQIARKES